jgi:hypothetical protein
MTVASPAMNTTGTLIFADLYDSSDLNDLNDLEDLEDLEEYMDDCGVSCYEYNRNADIRRSI